MKKTLSAAVRRLEQANIDSPKLSAELLLAFALGMERAELVKHRLLNPAATLTPQAESSFRSLVERRAAGEPAAYLIGYKEFYGREFGVSSAVLIPRPETELLVDKVLDFARVRGEYGLRFADFGTGSGCIALTLGVELPHAKGIAVDISPAALNVASANAARLSCRNVAFVSSDFALPFLQAASFDFIAANPPYVSAREYAGLSPEVRDHEPISALVGTRNTECADGLELPAAAIRTAQYALKPGGALFMEIGGSQGKAVRELFEETEWSEVAVLPDLAGLDRLAVAVKARNIGEYA